MSEKKEKTLWGVICVLLILIGGVFTFYSARMLKNNNVFAKQNKIQIPATQLKK